MVVSLVKMRQKKGKIKIKMKSDYKKLIGIMLFFYFASAIWIILFKMEFRIEDIDRIRLVNLVPFALIKKFGSLIIIRDFLLNILAFIPLGILVKAINYDGKIFKSLLLGFFFSIFIELSQYLMSLGVSDTTDIISNSLGTYIGIILYTYLVSLLTKNKVDKILVKILFPLGIIFSLGLVFYRFYLAFNSLIIVLTLI